MRRWLSLLLLLTAPLLFAKGADERTLKREHPPLNAQSRFVIALPKSEDELFLDPLNSTDAASLLVLEGLFEGLYSLNSQTGEPILALAKEVFISDDGLTWRFTLDKNGYFSNGAPITAQTFVDSWLFLLSENPYLASMFDCIEGAQAYRTGQGAKSAVGINAINATTLELQLLYRSPYLPALLATRPFAALYNKHLTIFSGPYEIIEKGAHKIILAKQPYYRDSESVKSDFIEILFLDEEALINAYTAGLVDWTPGYIPPEALQNNQDLRLGREYSTAFYYFSSKQEAYRDERVRKALALLIPWQQLRQNSRQIFPTARLIPDLQGPVSVNSGRVNKEAAFDLLKIAGYPYGAGLPPLNMAIHKGAQFVESGQTIADTWSKALGLTVTLDVVPLGMYSRYPALSPYDFSFITWVGDFHDPLSFLLLFTSSSDYNLSNSENKAYDALVERALASKDEKERESLVAQAEQFLLEEALVFPLFHGLTTNVINSQRVKGWYDNILDNHPLKALYREFN
ncbi:MAG: peptide ABC transporter substrate-binding protein [Sphaerochaetaceae bacterium]